MRTPKLYTTKLHKFEVTYTHPNEFHQLKNELFTNDVYYFETENPRPKIVDIGAHIGLSTLYFKKLYALAEITAVEPHPFAFKLLKQNLWQNHFDDVTTLNIAIDPYETELTLHVDTETEWLSTSSIHPGAWSGDQATEAITVPAQPLSSIITQPIDLLKLDVEGAEQHILENSAEVLPLVKEMFVEFHRRPSQDLGRFVQFLEEQGFIVHLSNESGEVTVKRAKALTLIHAVRKS